MYTYNMYIQAHLICNTHTDIEHNNVHSNYHQEHTYIPPFAMGTVSPLAWPIIIYIVYVHMVNKYTVTYYT